MALLARRASKSSARLDRTAKVGCAIGVPVDLLHSCVAVTVTSSIAVGSGMVDVPDLFAVGAGEEAAQLSVKRAQSSR